MTAVTSEDTTGQRGDQRAATVSWNSSATAPLRMVAYCLALAALAFNQSPGLIAPDTKLDLAIDPAGFLGRAAHLWDPLAAFGQVQNQAYGYFWPMGPFFVVGDALGLSPWVTQRLWWSLLLAVAFVGVVLLCRAMDIGRPWTRVVAGFAFALSVHTLTLLGPTSVEAWPSAVAPWVLLPLVYGTRGWSARRAAALSALAVAMCGGVNAVATAAVLPLGALWLVTREPGRQRRSLFGWWVALTILATLWWMVPLLLLGRYSPPFLDYIENAAITTLPTGLSDIIGGTSNWVAYVSTADWRAGSLLADTPILLIDAAVLAGLGLLGACRRDNPHRVFLLSGVLAGLLLVSFGYVGALHGWFATERQALLDGSLAPFRNLHKFDVVLRIPLALGLAHLLSRLRLREEGWGHRLLVGSGVLAALVGVAGVAVPALLGRVAPPYSVTDIPPYWQQAADYLDEHQEDGRALVLPAATFGEYWWGSTHDDVLQPLTASPWAVRNVIPLAQPGNIRLLDEVTDMVEGGRPNDELADFLSGRGVGYLVVRNDLDLLRADAPERVLVHQALNRSPGLTKVAEFGPRIGEKAETETDDGTPVFRNRGRSASYASVEIYRVDGGAPPADAWVASSVPVVAGSPSSAMSLRAAASSAPAVLAGDASSWPPGSPTVLTDDLRRRETNFARVRYQQSVTLGESDDFVLDSVEPNYRLYDDQPSYETTATWAGVSSVESSSSQAFADAVGVIDPAKGPAAALDADPETAWQSTGFSGAVGQWWQVDFEEGSTPGYVAVTMGPAFGPRVTQLLLETDTGTVEVEAPQPGATGWYALPAEGSSYLRIEAAEVEGSGQGLAWAIAEVTLPDVDPERYLEASSTGLTEAPTAIVFQRDVGRPACALAARRYTCDDSWIRASEEPAALRRMFDVPGDATRRYALSAEATLRPGIAAADELMETLQTQVVASSQLSTDPRAGALAVLDDDAATTWVADTDDESPELEVRWPRSTSVSSIDLRLSNRAAASRPTEVELVSDDARRVVELGDNGTGRFQPFDASEVAIRFLEWEEALSREAGEKVPLPVGVSGMSIADVPADDLTASSTLQECGQGPVIELDGASSPSSVSGSAAALMAGRPAEVTPCRGDTVSLPPGMHRLTVAPTWHGQSRSGRPATHRQSSDRTHERGRGRHKLGRDVASARGRRACGAGARGRARELQRRLAGDV